MPNFWHGELGADIGRQLDNAFVKLRSSGSGNREKRLLGLRSLEALRPHLPNIEINEGFRKLVRELAAKDATRSAGAHGEFDAARRALAAGDLAPGTKYQFGARQGARLPSGRGRLTGISEADGLRVDAAGRMVATEAKSSAAAFAKKLTKGDQFENMVRWWSKDPRTRRIEVAMAQDSGLHKLLTKPRWGMLRDIVSAHPSLSSARIFRFAGEATSFDELLRLRRAYAKAEEAGMGPKGLRARFESLRKARAAVKNES